MVTLKTWSVITPNIVKKSADPGLLTLRVGRVKVKVSRALSYGLGVGFFDYYATMSPVVVLVLLGRHAGSKAVDFRNAVIHDLTVQKVI